MEKGEKHVGANTIRALLKALFCALINKAFCLLLGKLYRGGKKKNQRSYCIAVDFAAGATAEHSRFLE